jgi:MFS family permease
MQDPRPPRSTRYAWYVTCLLAFAYFVSYVDRIILSLLVEPMKRDLGVGDTEMSLLLGFSFAIFYAVLGIPIARLADRASRTKIIAAGIFIWSLMTAFTGIARSYATVLLARIGVGVGESALSPATYSLLSDYFRPTELVRPMSVYHMGGIVGIGTAFMIGGAVAELAQKSPEYLLPWLGTIKSWQLAFFIVGLPGLLVALLIALTVAEPARTGSIGSQAGRVTFGSCLRHAMSHKRAYAALFLAPGICSALTFGTLSWTPTHIMRLFGLAPGDTGLYYGLSVVASSVTGFYASALLASWLERRGHADAILRACAYAAILALAPTYLAFGAPTFTQFIVLQSIGSFFCVMPFVLCPTGIQLITPNELRATLSSFYLLFTSLFGMAAGPTLVAVLAEHRFGGAPGALGQGLQVVACITLPLCAAAAALGRKEFARAATARAAALPRA